MSVFKINKSLRLETLILNGVPIEKLKKITPVDEKLALFPMHCEIKTWEEYNQLCHCSFFLCSAWLCTEITCV